MNRLERKWRLPLGAAVAAAAMAVSIAVASNASTPAAGNYVSDVTLVTNTSPSNSNSFKDIDVYCPTGKKAIGGGADLVGGQVGSGTSKTSPVLIHRNAPIGGPPATDPTGPTGPTTGWRATGSESSAYAGKWAIKVYAICAKVDSPAPVDPGASTSSSGTSGSTSSSGTSGNGSSGTTTGDNTSGGTSGNGSSGTTTGDNTSGGTSGNGSSGTTTGDNTSGGTSGNGSSGTTTGDNTSGGTSGNGSSGTTTGDSTTG
jgi:hypothetical protein